MSRRLRVLNAGVDRPDERHLGPEDRRGPRVTLRVISVDLKAQPVHSLDLSPDEAVRLAAQLLAAVQSVQGRPL